MDDLISRQAAIDALDVLCGEHRYRIPGKRETYSEYNEAWQDALDRAQGLIFNLPSAEQDWIPCSERLPEVNEDGESNYILLSCSNYSLPTIGRYQVDDQGGAFYDGDDDKPLVSYGLFANAWMPLPEPYKAERREE